MKKVWVISLGGSRIVPDNVDDEFLLKFKKLIDSHNAQKFVIVTGGGSTARKYISALRKLGESTKTQSMEGIAITRLHAKFMSILFGRNASNELPLNIEKIERLLRKNRVVFCGALRYEKKNTSDGTAAKIARHLKCPFINLTNVKGLYTSDPRKNKNAKFIKEIKWGDFAKFVNKIKYKAGQHFVLDQNAARIIERDKITTYIVGSLTAIDNILRKKKFVGTLISG